MSPISRSLFFGLSSLELSVSFLCSFHIAWGVSGKFTSPSCIDDLYKSKTLNYKADARQISQYFATSIAMFSAHRLVLMQAANQH